MKIQSTTCDFKGKSKVKFDILEDTLIGYRIPAFAKVMKRRLVQAPRFYFFDIGVTNYLLHRQELRRGTEGYGHAFEHLVIQELVAWLSIDILTT